MAIKVRKRREDGEPPEDEEETDEAAVEPTDHDPFMRGSMRTISWFAENQNLVVVALFALVLAGVGIYVGTRYMRQQAVSASKGVSQALLTVEAPVEGSQAYQTMTSSENAAAPDDTYPSEEKKWNAVYKSAGKTLDKKPGGRIAQIARATRAAAAIRIGKPDEAIELYTAYLDNKQSAISAPFVHYGLAVARADKENYQKALKALDGMIEADDNYESLALYHKGLFMERAGKIDKAKEFYNKVLETNPETPYKSNIERRLALL